MYCDVCGHINGHAYGCPEAPQPKPVYTCKECGTDIYVGDIAFKVSGFREDKWYCCECCAKYEVESPEEYEPDWDDIRKERLDAEF